MAWSGDGSGTLDDPYIVTSAAQLKEIEDDMSAYYKQLGDITLGNFEPIGYASGTGYTAFQGEYDGDNYTIKDGTISYSSDSYIGIFAYAAHVYFKDINISNVNVSGDDYTGTLVGYSADSTYHNVKVYGGVVTGASGANFVAGIVGLLITLIQNTASEMRGCSNTSTVTSNTGSACYTGGITGAIVIGAINNSTVEIIDCKNSGVITGVNGVGGILGYMSVQIGTTSTCLVYRSINDANLEAIASCGGIAGYVGRNSTVNRCYALCTTLTRTSGTNALFYRIAGDLSAGTLLNNYALDTMAGPEAFTDKTTSGLDGADVTSANAKLEATYTSNNYLPIPFYIDGIRYPYIPDLKSAPTLSDISPAQIIDNSYNVYFNENNVDLATDDDGNIYASFKYYNTVSTLYVYGIYKSTDNGVTWATINLPQYASQKTGTSASAKPAITWDSTEGKLHVVFTDVNSSDSDRRVYYNAYNPSTDSWDNASPVSLNAPSTTWNDYYIQARIAIAGDNDDIVIAITCGTNPNIYYIVSSDGGATWGSWTSLIAYGKYIDIRSVSDGIIAVYELAINGDPYYNKYTSGVWGSPASIDNVSLAVNSCIRSNSNGFVWAMYKNTTPSPDNIIFCKQVGSSWIVESGMTISGTDSYRTFVIDKKNYIHYFYYDSGAKYKMYNGIYWSTAQSLPLYSGTSSETHYPSIYYDGNNYIYVAYSENDTGWNGSFIKIDLEFGTYVKVYIESTEEWEDSLIKLRHSSAWIDPVVKIYRASTEEWEEA